MKYSYKNINIIKIKIEEFETKRKMKSRSICLLNSGVIKEILCWLSK